VIPALFLLVGLIFSLVYGVLFLWVILKWHEVSEISVPESFQPNTFISVLIPARNEREHLPDCLEALFQQDYPRSLWEVIVIDDHSTDGTPEWVKEDYGDQVRVLRLKDFLAGKPVVAFKKAALTYGVQEARGDWILTTDADTLSRPRWLRTLAFYAENQEVDALAGPVRYGCDRGFLARFQALDNAASLLLTAAGLSSGRWVLGNGANLAFRRNTFLRLDGYEGNLDGPSGDDLFLLQKWIDSGVGVGFIKHRDAIIDTFPEQSWEGLLAQRLRWAGKRVDVGLRLIQAWVFGYYALVAIGLVGGILVFREWWWMAWALFLWKAVIDYFWIRAGVRFLQQENLLKSYGLAAPFYMLYILGVGSLSLTGIRKNWKGRSWK
jgi:cellulose synthase/poly-beta-1,6-N-acetylglucosamine synthase-like glycosyltransferase